MVSSRPVAAPCSPAAAALCDVLDGVTLNGTLNFSPSSGNDLTIQDGLVLNGTINVTNGGLSFNDLGSHAQSLTGTGSVNLANSLDPSAAFTMSPPNPTHRA